MFCECVKSREEREVGRFCFFLEKKLPPTSKPHLFYLKEKLTSRHTNNNKNMSPPLTNSISFITISNCTLFPMLHKKHLDIKLHFSFIKPGKGSIQLKKQDFPIHINSIVPSNFNLDLINTKMSLSSMETILDSFINDAKINGFYQNKNTYTLNKSQLFRHLFIWHHRCHY